MKKQLLFLIGILGFIAIQAQDNPFAEFGYTPKVATLSQGQFNESFDNDSIVQIGSVLFNTKTKQIVAFVEYDTLYSEATLEPDIVSRWMSPDPLAYLRNWVSPYNFVQNNPIIRIDPTGALDDHWSIDEKGNAKLLDTEGDEIYVNNELISEFQFNDQNKLNALSDIAAYYHNQNNGSDLHNNKVSVLAFEGFKISGSSNWDLGDKPYNGMRTPLLFAYPQKQFGTNENRIVVPVENGTISSTLSNKWNLRNALVHENLHNNQPLDKYDYKSHAAYFELDAYQTQMSHSTWNKTTSDFRGYMLSNTKSYLNQLKISSDPDIQERFNSYVNFFNSIKK
ncbi:MAG: hypothetical protein KDC83_07995 [Flavobacteriales bacterium]|nr:hypothetical protein [Flavobacteriales bacterium]